MSANFTYIYMADPSVTELSFAFSEDVLPMP